MPGFSVSRDITVLATEGSRGHREAKLPSYLKWERTAHLPANFSTCLPTLDWVAWRQNLWQQGNSHSFLTKNKTKSLASLQSTLFRGWDRDEELVNLQTCQTAGTWDEIDRWKKEGLSNPIKVADSMGQDMVRNQVGMGGI